MNRVMMALVVLVAGSAASAQIADIAIEASISYRTTSGDFEPLDEETVDASVAGQLGDAFQTNTDPVGLITLTARQEVVDGGYDLSIRHTRANVPAFYGDPFAFYEEAFFRIATFEFVATEDVTVLLTGSSVGGGGRFEYSVFDGQGAAVFSAAGLYSGPTSIPGFDEREIFEGGLPVAAGQRFLFVNDDGSTEPFSPTNVTLEVRVVASPRNPADLFPAPDGDGVLDINDVLTFASAFNEGGAAADLFPDGGDGTFDINDVLVFAAAFNAGQP